MLGIDYDYQYLERFFSNLLLGQQHELKNRFLIIDAPDNWNITQEKKKNATVNATVSTKPTINATERAVLQLIENNNCITYDEMAAALQKDRSTIYRTIKKLTSKGLLTRKGSDKAGHWEIIEEYNE